jgi:protein O-mannosyl-transferase
MPLRATKAQPDVPPASARRDAVIGTVALVALTLLAYSPAFSGSFIWDDNNFLTDSPLIKAADGLRRFWLTAQAPDYWPLTSSTLWLEWRLWGMNAAGYHATNVILHVVEALLLWRVLRQLRIPGAYLGALIFALHPVNAESVVWITQRKNLVAMLFFLLSLRWFLKDTGTGRYYALSLVAFALALLGKGSVAPLPLVLLGTIAWRRRLEGRDWLRVAPFFAVATAFTAVNLTLQAHHYAPFRTAGLPERLAGAGAIVWFYLGKAVWPVALSFVYPHWTIRTGDLGWWMPLLSALALTALLWSARRTSVWARAGLFAWGYFCVMLTPVLGLTDVAYMKFSLVADHYQHLALLGVTAFAGAALATGWRRLPAAAQPAGWAVGGALLAVLGLLTLRQSRIDADPRRLYVATLERNPESSLAHNNLAILLADEPGRQSEAIAHYEAALRSDPNMGEAEYNLGSVLLRMPGRKADAIEHYEAAVRINPGRAVAQNSLGRALAAVPGRAPEAIAHLEEAVRLDPSMYQAHFNLADALAARPGRRDDAIAHYEAGLRLDPNNVEAQNNFANVLSTIPSRVPDAIEHYEAALRLNPNIAEIHCNLADALATLPGRSADAIAHYEQALRLNPNLGGVREKLDELRLIAR